MTWRLAPLPPKSALAALVFGIAIFSAQPARAQKDFSQPPQMDQAPSNGAPKSRNTRFTLINGSDQNIDNLNISPTDDDSWGDDLLGDARPATP